MKEHTRGAHESSNTPLKRKQKKNSTSFADSAALSVQNQKF